MHKETPKITLKSPPWWKRKCVRNLNPVLCANWVHHGQKFLQVSGRQTGLIVECVHQNLDIWRILEFFQDVWAFHYLQREKKRLQSLNCYGWSPQITSIVYLHVHIKLGHQYIYYLIQFWYRTPVMIIRSWHNVIMYYKH